MPIQDFTDDFAQGFDDIRNELLGVTANLVLLEEDGESQAFNVLQTVRTGWYPEYSTHFGNTTFHIADITADTGKNIRKTSFVAIMESDLEVNNGILFELKPETAQPDTNIPWWRVRAQAVSRRYVPDDSEA